MTIIRRIGMLGLGSLLAVMSTAAQPAQLQAPPSPGVPAGGIVPGAYIVQLRPGFAPETVAADHAVTRKSTYRSVFAGFAGTVPPGRLSALRADPRVQRVVPDRVVHLIAPAAKEVGSNKRPGGGGGGSGGGSSQVVPAGVQRIGAAPGLLGTGLGVGVAIADTGIDLNHPDLAVQLECFPSYPSCQDDNDHGTHVAGTVAALDNSAAVVGVAPGVDLYAVKVLDAAGNGTDSGVIAGLQWILDKSPAINVVNMSLGRPASGNPADDAPMHNAIAALAAANITVVVAAGNDPAADVANMVPANSPGALPIASATAAQGSSGACGTVARDTASYFTTDGSGVVVSGPGEEKEDIKGCIIRSVGILSLKRGGGTTRMSGTSMAAPHATGVAALLYQQNAGVSPAVVEDKLLAGAQMVDAAPLHSPTGGYSFDGTQEGVLWAPGALSPP